MTPPATIQQLERLLQGLPLALLEEMLAAGQWVELPAGQEVLRAGQYVRVLPVVFSGAIKVYSQFAEGDLLLYYIQARESCVLSFSAILEQQPSQVYAVTEQPTTALLLPSAVLPDWTRRYPVLSTLLFRQFHQRYTDLLATIEQMMFHRMDHRLYQYLQDKCRLRGSNLLQLRHREIAADLGTAREVVTRTMKKLEAEGLVTVRESGLEVHLPAER